MKPLPHVLLALAMLGGGILLGRSISPGVKNSPEAHEDPIRTTRTSRNPSTNTAPGGERHDLAGLKARHGRNVRTLTDQQRSMERLEVAVLKSLVLEQFASLKDAATDEEKMAHRQVAHDALGEFYKREGIGALEWADGLEGNDHSSAISSVLLALAFKDNPEAAKPWLEKYTARHGRGFAIFEIYRSGIQAAVERSADDLIRVIEIFDDKGFVPLHRLEFPEDFDFAKLHTAMSRKTDINMIISQWTARDRDAAWNAVKGQLEMDSKGPSETTGAFDALMKGVIAKDGEAAGVAWAMERLKELPGSQKAASIQQLDEQGELSVEGMAAVAGHLDEKDQVMLARSVISRNGASPKTYAILDAMPRSAVVALLSGDIPLIPLYRGPAKGTAAYGSQRERLRAELQSRYQLTPEELEKIVK